jgi:RNA polymerase sigma factor (sigma-70 family)
LNFESLYEEHKSLVYNLALQYVQNIEDAEEITQDVFISIYESIDSFREQARISTWIYRITINKSLDFLRAKKRKKRFAFLVSLFNQDGVGIKYDKIEFNHPGILLEQKEQMKMLFESINQLQEKQKTVIILLKIERKSQAETAEIMDVSVKAVESLYQRAKNNLSKMIAGMKDSF